MKIVRFRCPYQRRHTKVIRGPSEDSLFSLSDHIVLPVPPNPFLYFLIEICYVKCSSNLIDQVRTNTFAVVGGLDKLSHRLSNGSLKPLMVMRKSINAI